jgi:carbon storage regulator
MMMLVLSRKIGEKIVVGKDVFITVLEVRGDTVKLGMEAPKHISIHREEIYQEILSANQQASVGAQPSKSVDATLFKAKNLVLNQKQ